MATRRGPASKSVPGDDICIVADLDELKELQVRPRLVFVIGGEGGTYVWRVGDTTPPADKAIVAPTDGESGRWRRLAGMAPVQAFGAKGDRSSDDTAAIRAAIAALPNGGILYFSPGVYRISEEIEGISNLEIAGHGATIVSDDVIRSYFHFAGKHNIVVRDCTFDMNMPNLPTYAVPARPPQNVALYFDGGTTNVSVTDNLFVNLYTNAVRFHQAGGALSLVSNTFRSPVQTQMLVLEHAFFLTVQGLISIRQNTFTNSPVTSSASVPAGMFIAGARGSISIEANRFDYCGRDNTGHHRVGVIDFYDNCENVTVANNTSSNTIGVFMRLEAAWPARIYGNFVERSMYAESGGNTIVVGSTATHAGLNAGKVGARDVSIYDNSFTGATGDNHGIVVIAYDYSVPSTHIKIHHNTFTDFKFAVAVIGPFDDVSIDNNSFGGAHHGSLVEVLQHGGNVVIGADHGVTEAQSIYRALAIRGNSIMSPLKDLSPIQINFSKTPPFTGSIDGIVISHNVISALNGSDAAAVSASTGVRPYAGSISIRDNTVSGFATAFLVRNFRDVTIAGNDTHGITGAVVVEEGNGTYNKRSD